MACGLLTVVVPPTSFANEPQDAHAMAQQFANAHKSKPKKLNPKDAIQPQQVEGAFEVRSQESELKTTDQILESIEARTEAIEALLEESTSDKWNVYVGKPATVIVQVSPEAKADVATATPDTQASIRVPQATTKVIAPQPSASSARSKDIPSPDWAATTERAPSQNDDQATLRDDTPTPVIADTSTKPDGAPDVTELPEPGYALGGPGNLRYGLEEASSILSTATVLLKMEPGNTGLRRFKKTADPVLCGRRHCYMSKGFQEKAYRMLRGTALGPFNTLGRRAGACRQKLTCVFRHVDLMDDGILLQPVDLKFMRHDRRAYRNMKVDRSCTLSGGRLHCANPIKAKTWTAWIVPEHIALEAGSDALETALQDGLPETPIPSIHVKRAVP